MKRKILGVVMVCFICGFFEWLIHGGRQLQQVISPLPVPDAWTLNGTRSAVCAEG